MTLSRKPPLLLLVVIGWFTTNPVVSSHTEMFFSEPFTALRVTSYQVELFVSANDKKQFSIPEQCADILEAMEAAPDQWGSQVDRLLWSKVGNDCQYYDLAHRFSASGVKDFVSGYDFRNARISDFPMRWDCDFSESSTHHGCTPMHYRVPDVSLLPSFERGKPESSDFTEDACYLEGGVYRGIIRFSEEGLFCKKERYGPGFRIISVDFSDTNYDGFMDAIVRLIPIGARGSRVPILYRITRFSADAPFSSMPE